MSNELNWFRIAEITSWDWDRSPESFGPPVYLVARSPTGAVSDFLRAVGDARRKVARLEGTCPDINRGDKWFVVIERSGFLESEQRSYIVDRFPHTPIDVMLWSESRDKEIVSKHFETATKYANRELLKLKFRVSYIGQVKLECPEGARDGDCEFLSADEVRRYCRATLAKTGIVPGYGGASNWRGETLFIRFELDWKAFYEIYVYRVSFCITETAYLVEDRFLYAIPANTYEREISDVATKPLIRDALVDALGKQCAHLSDWVVSSLSLRPGSTDVR